jgi:hypothetical protein
MGYPVIYQQLAGGKVTFRCLQKARVDAGMAYIAANISFNDT